MDASDHQEINCHTQMLYDLDSWSVEVGASLPFAFYPDLISEDLISEGIASCMISLRFA
jgi:hypothetical protein